jgi:hypothetical protein
LSSWPAAVPVPSFAGPAVAVAETEGSVADGGAAAPVDDEEADSVDGAGPADSVVDGGGEAEAVLDSVVDGGGAVLELAVAEMLSEDTLVLPVADGTAPTVPMALALAVGL